MQNDHNYRFLAADHIRQLQQQALGDHLLDDRLRALLRGAWMKVGRAWPCRSARAMPPCVPMPAASAGPVACDCRAAEPLTRRTACATGLAEPQFYLTRRASSCSVIICTKLSTNWGSNCRPPCERISLRALSLVQATL